MQNKRFDTRRMVMLALFCALASATLIVLHIKVGFMTLDIKDAVITVAAMLFGPSAGAIISLVVATIELAASGGNTGFYGWVMDFISTAVFAVIASSIYRAARRMWSAVIGLMTAVLCLTAVMLGLDLFIVPLYTGVTTAEVAALIPSYFLPFNFIKATLNAALVMMIYKPISFAMKKAHITQSIEGEEKPTLWRSIIFTLIGAAVITICIFVLIDLMGGDFLLYDPIVKAN